MSNIKPTIACDQDIPYLSDWLSPSCRLINYQAGELSVEKLREADGLIVRSVTSIHTGLLENSPCRWVGSVTAGLNHLDTAGLEAAGVEWCYAPGANAPAVCEYVVSGLHAASQAECLAAGAKIAVIGVGEVGSRVVAACERLGFRVASYDPPREARDTAFTSTSWNDLVECDFLIVCASYSKKGEWPSHALIDADRLQQWPKLRGVINAARGEIMDYKALFSTSIWTCLDVWPNEPSICEQWVSQADIATPHIAGYTLQSKWRLSFMIYNACCQFFNLPKQNSSLPQEGLSSGSVPLKTTSQTMKAAILKENTPAVFHALRKNYPLRSES